MNNKNTISYFVLVALLIASSIFSLKLFFKEKTSHDKLEIKKFPYKIGDWVGKDLEIKDYEYKILETKNLIAREYSNPSGEKIILFIIYSETNRSVFHPPEVCFVGSGMEIIDKNKEEIKISNKKFYANKMYAEKNNRRELVLYSYKVGDFYTDSYYLQQSLFAFNQLFKSNSPGATVRVSMPIIKDEAITLNTLKAFLGKTTEIVDNLK